MLKQLSIVPQSASDEAKATEIAESLGLKCRKTNKGLRLLVSKEGLAIQQDEQHPMAPDFSWSGIAKKRQEGRQLGIVRACRPCAGMRIFDVTAGWGRDAAILASFGAQVVMFERNPIMQLLLEDALARQDAISQDRLKLTLIKTDAQDFLAALEADAYPDIIYMDPMHPARKKSAKVKKDLQLLQQMIGPDEDALSLLAIARAKVKKKLVLKWPSRASSLLTPNTSISGSTVRYDCFFPQ